MQPVCKPVQAEIRDSLRQGASQAAGEAPTLRYGPAGDSAPRLRLKAAGMDERFPFGPSTRPECHGLGCYGYLMLSNEIQNHWLICILPFPRKQPSLQIGPQRSRARSGAADP